MLDPLVKCFWDFVSGIRTTTLCSLAGTPHHSSSNKRTKKREKNGENACTTHTPACLDLLDTFQKRRRARYACVKINEEANCHEPIPQCTSRVVGGGNAVWSDSKATNMQGRVRSGTIQSESVLPNLSNLFMFEKDKVEAHIFLRQ